MSLQGSMFKLLPVTIRRTLKKSLVEAMLSISLTHFYLQKESKEWKKPTKERKLVLEFREKGPTDQRATPVKVKML